MLPKKIKIIVLEDELKSKLKAQGVDFIHFVDISQLSNKQNKNFPNAILIGMALSQHLIMCKI